VQFVKFVLGVVIGLIVGMLAGLLVGEGLAYVVGCEDEFCTVTGLALLVGFFGGPILGGYVALHH
jgi:hypothetical protein